MLDGNKPAQTQTLGIGAPGLRCRRNRRRQAAHPGWVRPLATHTVRFSHCWMVAPTNTVGRCPLPAVLSMPSSRRSVTAKRVQPPLLRPILSGRSAPYRPTRQDHFEPGTTQPLRRSADA
jgi:hypothetical protein